MEKATEKEKIPEEILKAYDMLLQHRLVDITRSLKRESHFGNEGWAFNGEFSVPYPNPAGIPAKVMLKFIIHDSFPLSSIDVYSLSREVAGFPHQELISNKICLKNDSYAPRTTKKLITYVSQANEWLADAANNNLVQTGEDPYELPDFNSLSIHNTTSQKYPVFFNESKDSFCHWKKHLGNHGAVDVVFSKLNSAYYACCFRDQGKQIICETDFSSVLEEINCKMTGSWILLDEIVFERHRPPITFGEIVKLCDKSEIDFYAIVRQAWECNNFNDLGIVMLGFPIPQIFGKEPVEIHWQPVWINDWKSDKKIIIRGKRNKRGNIWKYLTDSGRFSMTQIIPWGKSENVSNERLFSRNSFTSNLRQSKIAVIGCGALGSPVVEYLARGGIADIVVIDFDSLHPGNLSRHTVHGTFINKNKAKAIARKLSITFPLISVKGYEEHIPPDRAEKLENIQNVLLERDLLIDCTTSESAFEWMNNLASKNGKKLISMFFNAYAEILTICISGTNTSCLDVYRDLCLGIEKNELPVDKTYYFREISKEEQISEGAGCWHPTFPAQNVHIQLLAATATDLINSTFKSSKDKGYAALIKREYINAKNEMPFPVVQLIWEKVYP